jgi:ribosomal protein S27AE
LSSSLSLQDAAVQQADSLTISGHPTLPLLDWDSGNLIQTITVCVECGATHSIIMLVSDRWYCSKCRIEGRVDRNVKMFPIS